MADIDFTSEVAVEVAAEHAPELVKLVESHAGVEEVVHDAESGRIVVRYDERHGAGAYLRGALRDRLAILSPPPKPQRPVTVAVVHESIGRVRLKVAGGELAERLRAFVADLPGVERASTSPATNTVLVTFDPKRTSRSALIEAIEHTPPRAWPEAAPPPESPYFEWVKTGFSGAVLAGAITGIVPAPIMLGGVALTALPPFRRALASLAAGRVNVDVMDAVAISVCVLRSDPITASVITTLLS